MALRMFQALARRHVPRLDHLRPAMAKAVRKEDPAWRAAIGKALTRAWDLAGLSRKEVAALIDRDPAQLARWESGEDRPQFDVIFSVPVLRRPMVQALAQLDTDTLVETVIHMRSEGR